MRLLDLPDSPGPDRSGGLPPWLNTDPAESMSGLMFPCLGWPAPLVEYRMLDDRPISRIDLIGLPRSSLKNSLIRCHLDPLEPLSLCFPNILFPAFDRFLSSFPSRSSDGTSSDPVDLLLAGSFLRLRGRWSEEESKFSRSSSSSALFMRGRGCEWFLCPALCLWDCIVRNPEDELLLSKLKSCLAWSSTFVLSR